MSPQALGKACTAGRVKKTNAGLYDVELCRLALKLKQQPRQAGECAGTAAADGEGE